MLGNEKMPAAMILCGGQGTRIRDLTDLVPKPMIQIGPRPMIWHIKKIYASFGVKHFILCLGYKREAFVDYFLNFREHNSDLTINLGGERDVTYHGDNGGEDWTVTLVDTGEAAMTGARIARAAKYLGDGSTDFFMTYGDAVANVDIAKLYRAHRAGGRALTVTAVHPVGRFGEMQIAGSEVTSFHEKPQTAEGFINGGFMVMTRDFVSRYLRDETDLILEQEPLMTACRDGQMLAWKHPGFWQCMDTAREYDQLNRQWAAGDAPWTEAWK